MSQLHLGFRIFSGEKYSQSKDYVASLITFFFTYYSCDYLFKGMTKIQELDRRGLFLFLPATPVLTASAGGIVPPKDCCDHAPFDSFCVYGKLFRRKVNSFYRIC